VVQDANEDRQTALRPLREVGAVLASLRGGSIPEGEVRAAVMGVADAVERSLRRLLRDLPAAAMEVRLSALASDELREDELLAELRQHDRISMELAAAVHDLLRTRKRLRDGAPAEPRDAALATQAADRLEHEIANPVHFPRQRVDEPPVVDETLVHPVPVEGAEDVAGRRRSRWVVPVVALAAILVVAALAWRLVPRGPTEMDEGIALFQSGNVMDAASHFWRYAEEHPSDPTPHLYLARIHRRTHRFDMAAQELKKALDLDPSDLDAQTELGFLLLDTRRFDLAVQRFGAVLKRDTTSRDAWVGLVAALRFSGRPEAAQRALDSAPAAVRALVATRAAAARNAPSASPDSSP
jgi:tetratricopeptide (TPR) repeat protein